MKVLSYSLTFPQKLLVSPMFLLKQSDKLHSSTHFLNDKLDILLSLAVVDQSCHGAAGRKMKINLS